MSPPLNKKGNAPSSHRRYTGSKRSQGELGMTLLIEACRAFWQVGTWLVRSIAKRFR